VLARAALAALLALSGIVVGVGESPLGFPDDGWLSFGTSAPGWSSSLYAHQFIGFNKGGEARLSAKAKSIAVEDDADDIEPVVRVCGGVAKGLLREQCGLFAGYSLIRFTRQECLTFHRFLSKDCSVGTTAVIGVGDENIGLIVGQRVPQNEQS
jgi:hypothetical protein